jgi:hypothetical protein
MYVSRNAYPTVLTYDYANFSSNPPGTQEVDIVYPNVGNWEILVTAAANANATFSILGSAISACPNNCSNHGVCKSGVCSCTAPYTLADCSLPLVQLTTGLPSSVIALAPNEWCYFEIDVSASNSLDIAVTLFSLVDTAATSLSRRTVVDCDDVRAPTPPTPAPSTPAPTIGPAPTPTPQPLAPVAFVFVRAGALPTPIAYDLLAPVTGNETVSVAEPVRTANVVHD